MINFGPLTAEIGWRVCGTPADFNGFRILASLPHRRHWTEVNQTLHDVWPSPALVHCIYIFACSCPIQIQPTHQYRQDQGNGERRHSVSYTHSEWTIGTGEYVPISWVSDYGQCTTEFRTRLSRGQAIRASLQKIWKSHSVPISTKTRRMKALVWPVVTYGCESWTSERMKKHVLRSLRRKDWERFCVFRGQ